MDRAEVQVDGLQQLVKQSGGRVFRSASPCKELAAELRNQYLIGYRSTNRAKDGAWRDIRVRISFNRSSQGNVEPDRTCSRRLFRSP
jgi:hypothetical protein